MTGLRGLEFTSITGARSKLTPRARSSRPVISPARWALTGSPVAATPMAEGARAQSPLSRETTPPSWSMEISGGSPVCVTMSVRSSPHRRRSWAASRMFSSKRMMLPILYSATSSRRAWGTSVPGKPTASFCPTCQRRSRSMGCTLLTYSACPAPRDGPRRSPGTRCRSGRRGIHWPAGRRPRPPWRCCPGPGPRCGAPAPRAGSPPAWP